MGNPSVHKNKNAKDVETFVYRCFDINWVNKKCREEEEKATDTFSLNKKEENR
jgi:hypothetical protein